MQKIPRLLLSPIPLAVGQIHLWLLDIHQFDAAQRHAAHHLMSNDEHERAQKFIRGKEEYIASRWLLRRVLASYLHQPPESLVFNRNEKGKPFIVDSNLSFNLTHSGQWALLAVGYEPLIGVDIEQVSHSRDLSGIAENYFHATEFAYLQQHTGTAKTHCFYQLWTLKEALLKAMGLGISAGLDKVCFTLNDTGAWVNIAAELQTPPIANHWQFQQWCLSDGSFCALATAGEQPMSTCWFDPLQTLA